MAARKPANKSGRRALPKVKPLVIVAVKAKPQHGMSKEVKPLVVPHPTHPGRDINGRIMTPNAIAGAAPPFTAATRPIPPRARAQAQAMPVPTPAPVGLPPVQPQPAIAPLASGLGNASNMPMGPVSTGIPPQRGLRR